MDDCWIVAKTQPRRERFAGENITRQGHTFYLPQFLESAPVRNGVRHARVKPLFPSYIFVCTNGVWRFLLGTFGIASIVMVGERPAFLPVRAIDDLRKREGDDGVIALPQRERFKDGDVVRIGSGAFRGHTGIYKGANDQQRVAVLLNLLGRRTRVLIGDETIEAA